MIEEKCGELQWKKKHYSMQEMWMESVYRGSFCGLSTVQWKLCGTKILIINHTHSKMYLVIRQKMTLLCEAVIP
jgi:hypothetical protein